MASSGIGTPNHLAGELFAMLAGLKFLHIPYRGEAPALTDLLGGQVQMFFSFLPGSVEHIKSGTLRALAVTPATGWETLPDVPALGNFVSGYDVSTWAGFGAPASTPLDVVDRLNKVINEGLADSKVVTRLADLGAKPFVISPRSFARFIADETEMWGKVIRAANIKPE